jgi:hypothetical protein
MSLSPSPILSVEGQRPPATWPAMPAASHAKGQRPTGPRPNRPPLPRIHPCPMRARHVAVDSRRPSHDGPATLRPCRGIVPAAPPSAWPRSAPSPLVCAPIKGLHQAPAHTHPSTTTTAPLAPPLDLTVEPHLALHFHLSQAPESVFHIPLKLLDFPTPLLPRQTAVGKPPPRRRPTAPTGSPTPAISSPN